MRVLKINNSSSFKLISAAILIVFICFTQSVHSQCVEENFINGPFGPLPTMGGPITSEYGTPSVVDVTCTTQGDPNSVQLLCDDNANGIVGDGFKYSTNFGINPQPTFQLGKTYEFGFLKFISSDAPFISATVRVKASNVAITSYDDCPVGDCEVIKTAAIGTGFGICDASWYDTFTSFTPTKDYDNMIFSVLAETEMGETVIVNFDRICVQEVISECLAEFSYDIDECGILCTNNFSTPGVNYLWTLTGPNGFNITRNSFNFCEQLPEIGQYTLNLTISDASGCEDMLEQTFQAEFDHEMPVIDCWTDFTLDLSTPDCFTEWQFPMIEVSDNIDTDVTMICSIDGISVIAGQIVPVGVGIYTVECIAIDDCGNVSDTCKFDIIGKCEVEEPCAIQCCIDGPNMDIENMTKGILGNSNPSGWYAEYGDPAIVDGGCNGSLQSLRLFGAGFSFPGSSAGFRINGIIGQTNIFQKDSTYCLKFCAKSNGADSATPLSYLSIKATNGNPQASAGCSGQCEFITSQVISVNDTWNEYQINYTPTNDYSNIVFANGSAGTLDGPPQIFIDEVCVSNAIPIYNDTIPPSITCPQDMLIIGNDGINGCVASFLVPNIQASDNIGVDIIICNLDGVSVSGGQSVTLDALTTHTLMCIAIDLCGNTDTCETEITVFCEPAGSCESICESQFSINLSTGVDALGNKIPAGIGVIDAEWKLINNPPVLNCTNPLQGSLNGSAYLTNFVHPNTTAWINIPGVTVLSPYDQGNNLGFGCNNMINAERERVPYIFERTFCLCENAGVDLNIDFRGDDRIRFELWDLITNTMIGSSSTFTYPAVTSNWTQSFVLPQSTYALRAYLSNTNSTTLGFAVKGGIMLQNLEEPLLSNTGECCSNENLVVRKIIDMDCSETNTIGDQLGAGWTFNLFQSGTLVSSGVSNLNGEVVFTGLTPGTYTLSEVTKPGFVLANPSGNNLTITISQGGFHVVEFFNCPSPPVDCDSLMIMASTPTCIDSAVITGLPCLAVWDPVCGCDGETYSNGCYANEAGVTVVSQGECNENNIPTLSEGCCYNIDLKNNWGPDIVGLEVEMLSPGWIFNNVTTAFPFSFGNCPITNNKFCVKDGFNGSIPAGSSRALNFCLSATDTSATSIQIVEFRWLQQINEDSLIVCTDTLYFECPIPQVQDTCFDIVEQSIECDPEDPYKFDLCFAVKNRSSFPINYITLEDLDPSQFKFLPGPTNTKIVFPLPQPLNTGVTSNQICISLISGLPILQPDTLCLNLGAVNLTQDTCCHSPIELCVPITPCCNPCEDKTFTARPLDIGEGECCYAIDINNQCGYDYFSKIEFLINTPGVCIGSHVMDPSISAQFTITTTPNSMCIVPISGYLKKGNYIDFVKFCLDKIDDSSKDNPTITINWYGTDVITGEPFIACKDSIISECESPDDNICLQVTDQNLFCVEDSNKYQYTFTVTNRSNPRFIADKLHLFVKNDIANWIPIPSGNIITLPSPIDSGQTVTVTTCIAGPVFPAPWSDFYFSYRLQGGNDCCFESVCDTIPTPPCVPTDSTCCDVSMGDFCSYFAGLVTRVAGDTCEACFDYTDIDDCDILEISIDGAGYTGITNTDTCYDLSGGIHTLCYQLDRYDYSNPNEPIICISKDTCIEIFVECPPFECCDIPDSLFCTYFEDLVTPVSQDLCELCYDFSNLNDCDAIGVSIDGGPFDSPILDTVCYSNLAAGFHQFCFEITRTDDNGVLCQEKDTCYEIFIECPIDSTCCDISTEQFCNYFDNLIDRKQGNLCEGCYDFSGLDECDELLVSIDFGSFDQMVNADTCFDLTGGLHTLCFELNRFDFTGPFPVLCMSKDTCIEIFVECPPFDCCDIPDSLFCTYFEDLVTPTSQDLCELCYDFSLTDPCDELRVSIDGAPFSNPSIDTLCYDDLSNGIHQFCFEITRTDPNGVICQQKDTCYELFIECPPVSDPCCDISNTDYDLYFGTLIDYVQTDCKVQWNFEQVDSCDIFTITLPDGSTMTPMAGDSLCLDISTSGLDSVCFHIERWAQQNMFLPCHFRDTCFVFDEQCPPMATCPSCPFGSITGSDLIINGDFENGKTGFTSGYTASGLSTNTGQYDVKSGSVFGTTDPTWAQNDHTFGTIFGKMLVANGPLPNTPVWSQTVSVLEGNSYVFCAWVNNLIKPDQPNNGPPQVEVMINGTMVLVPVTTIDVLPNNWVLITGTWIAPAGTTTATLEIFNRQTSEEADLAIDDITFVECSVPPSICCKDEMKFDSLVNIGWQVLVTDCEVTVIAPQFDTCHWFGTDGPDWGDGSVTSPVITPAFPTQTYTHSYTTPGTYNICITVFEGDNIDDACWNAQMCTPVTIEACCNPGNPCDSTDIVVSPNSVSNDSCCYEVTIDNDYCELNYFKGFRIDMTGSSSISSMTGLNGYIINQINSNTAEVFHPSGFVPQGQQVAFRVCGSSSGSVTFTISWLIPDSQGGCEAICDEDFTRNCGSIDPRCVFILEDSIHCETNEYCVRIKNNSYPGFTINSIDLIGLTPSEASILPNPISVPSIAPGDTSDWICLTYSGVNPMDTVCFFVVGHNTDITMNEPPTWCCADTVQHCFVVPDCCDADPCDSTDIVVSPNSVSNDSCCYEVTIDNNYCELNYFKGFRIDMTGSSSISSITGLNGYIINQINSNTAEVFHPSGFVPQGQQAAFTVCGSSSGSVTFTISWLIPDGQGGCEAICDEDFTRNCGTIDPRCVFILEDSIHCETNEYCVRIKNNSYPGFTINSIDLIGLTPGGASILPNPISVPSIAPGDTSDWICLTYSGVPAGDSICFFVVGHNTDITQNEPPTWCCADTVQHCFMVPDCPGMTGCCTITQDSLDNLVNDLPFYIDTSMCEVCLDIQLDSCTYLELIVDGDTIVFNPGDLTGYCASFGVGLISDSLEIKMYRLDENGAICLVSNRVETFEFECVEEDCCDNVTQADLDALFVTFLQEIDFDSCGFCIDLEIDECAFGLILDYGDGTIDTLIETDLYCHSYNGPGPWNLGVTIQLYRPDGSVCLEGDSTYVIDFPNCSVSDPCCVDISNESLLDLIDNAFDDATNTNCQLCLPIVADSCDFVEVSWGDGSLSTFVGDSTVCKSYNIDSLYDITIRIYRLSNDGTICADTMATQGFTMENCSALPICKPNNITIFNAISPNGDNLNEYLDLILPKECGEVDVSIYNRWGQLVYTKQNYIDEWKGQSNLDRDLPDGTYFLILALPDARDEDGKPFKALNTFIDLRRDK